MTNEELIIKINQGHIELFSTLWEQVRRLVCAYANRYFTLYGDTFAKTGIEVEDLVQEGYFALLDAVQAYKPDSGYKFITFMRYPLKNHFNEVLGFRTAKGRNSTLSNAISLDKPTDGTEDMVLGDSVPDVGAQEEMQNVIENEYLRKLHEDLQISIGGLEDDQRDVVISHYFNGIAFADIALKVKKNYSMVKTLEQNALRRLRRDKRLRVYREEVMSGAYRRSFALWENTRTSSTERAAIALCDFDRFANWGKTAY
ncbi:MAG: sigma-70 family RNA polymerase sigma factor [Lachnospiraceae bacterium]|nr:sigma-70 family RNA polymerase sigma factor [Lachnospiraceae bacterium]